MNRPPSIDGTAKRLCLVALACLALGGCAQIQIVTPANGSFVAPTGSVTAQVAIQGQTCDTSFHATLDGVTVTSMFSPQPPASSTPQATFPALVPGDHLLTVSVQAGPRCLTVSATSTFYRVGPSSIYVTDGETSQLRDDRIVQMADMNGTGWTSFGSPGTGQNQFSFPRGVFVYSPTKIYIADQSNNRIVMIDDMTGAGWTAFGSQGYGVGQFWNPLGIFLDSAARIYITDSGTGRIVRMDDMTGKNWIQFGTVGGGTGQFRDPAGIFVDSSGKIYVADSTNSRIVRINDMTGAGWTSFGSKGAGINQFNVPNMLFVDPSGRIYITDSNNCRVVRINDMSGSGWTSVGTCGSGSLQFNGQTAFVGGVFVDTAGRIYVADAGNARLVRMNDMSGSGWITLGTFGSGTGQFVYLNNVFVKPPSEIIVGRNSMSRSVAHDEQP